MLCKHGECAVVNISSTWHNPGRKFYRCRHWKDKALDCDFFKWVDEVSSTDEDKLSTLQCCHRRFDIEVI
ncbi:hypothetical protein LINGRAHAP2_LOCUS31088 [Linum grandiflorum]